MLNTGLARLFASALSNASVSSARQACASSAICTPICAAGCLSSAAFVRGYFSGVFTTSYWRWRWMTAEARCS